MRRLATLVAIVAIAVTPGIARAIPPLEPLPEARGGGTVWPFDFVTEFSFVTGVCGFPVRIDSFQWHQTLGLYVDPVSLDDIENGVSILSQRFGIHRIHSLTVATNLTTGTSIETRAQTTLLRRDIDSDGLVDDEDGITGAVSATDSVSGNFGSLIVPGEGAVLLDVGHLVADHTSIYVDGIRVRRFDQVVTTSGQFTFFGLQEVCPYLA